MNISRLREIREDRGLLQREVAKVLKISQVVYSRYETGIRLMPIDKVAILAEFYGVSIDYLLGRTDVREPYPKSFLNENRKKLL